MTTAPTKSNWTRTDAAALREGVAVSFLKKLTDVRRRRTVSLTKKRNRK